MPIKTYIGTPDCGELVSVDCDDEYGNALLVTTRPRVAYNNSYKFFVNQVYGADMNQNAATGGTPLQVHNGIDTVLWTATAISGKWTFDSTDEAYAGTKSIKGKDTNDSDTSQIARGSSLDCSLYSSFSGWLYLSKYEEGGTKAVELYGWDTGTGAQVGVRVNLLDYIDVNAINSWQKFIISLSVLELEAATIDSIRLTTVDIGGGKPPDYYLDNLQFEESLGPLPFTLRPNLGEYYYVSGLKFSFADNIAGTLADGTMPGLSYDKLLGADLSAGAGINYQRVQGGEIKFSANIKSIGDLLSGTRSKIENTISDGTNTFVTVFDEFATDVLMKEEDDDKLIITINDDLSGLLFFRAFAVGKVERRY